MRPRLDSRAARPQASRGRRTLPEQRARTCRPPRVKPAPLGGVIPQPGGLARMHQREQLHRQPADLDVMRPAVLLLGLAVGGERSMC
jgi:hypothetical protein